MSEGFPQDNGKKGNELFFNKIVKFLKRFVSHCFRARGFGSLTLIDVREFLPNRKDL